jgi:ketosteroid isomerase-like protein
VADGADRRLACAGETALNEMITSELTNKQIMQNIFSEMARGESKLFVERMADDFRWIVAGTNQWSRTFDGKNAVLTDLFGLLGSKIALPIVTTDGDYVVDRRQLKLPANDN